MKWLMLAAALVLLVVIGSTVVHVAVALLGFVVVPVIAFSGGYGYRAITHPGSRKQLTR